MAQAPGWVSTSARSRWTTPAAKTKAWSSARGSGLPREAWAVGVPGELAGGAGLGGDLGDALGVHLIVVDLSAVVGEAAGGLDGALGGAFGERGERAGAGEGVGLGLFGGHWSSVWCLATTARATGATLKA